MTSGWRTIGRSAPYHRVHSECNNQLQEQRLAKASSIGALFGERDQRLFDELDGADISLSNA